MVVSSLNDIRFIRKNGRIIPIRGAIAGARQKISGARQRLSGVRDKLTTKQQALVAKIPMSDQQKSYVGRHLKRALGAGVGTAVGSIGVDQIIKRRYPKVYSKMKSSPKDFRKNVLRLTKYSMLNSLRKPDPDDSRSMRLLKKWGPRVYGGYKLAKVVKPMIPLMKPYIPVAKKLGKLGVDFVKSQAQAMADPEKPPMTPPPKAQKIKLEL
jgi:hypothetical protein